MKSQVLNKEGKKVREIELPKCFSSEIREDIVQKALETEKEFHPYSNYFNAGNQYSASGKVRHQRHKWKTAYGRGISRIPRKVMWRRGSQFYWIGATVPGTRGGRKAHPPKGIKKQKRINKKEYFIALNSAITATAKPELLQKKYSTLQDKKIEISTPLIIDSSFFSGKTKSFLESMKKILNELYDIAIPKKVKRSSKASMRGRKFKKTAGAVLVIGKNENPKISNMEIVRTNELLVSDLAKGGIGRLAIYTEQAVKELEKLDGGKNGTD